MQERFTSDPETLEIFWLPTSISTGSIFTVRKQDASNMSSRLTGCTSSPLVWLNRLNLVNLCPKLRRFRSLDGFQAEFQQVVHTSTQNRRDSSGRATAATCHVSRAMYTGVCTAITSLWIYDMYVLQYGIYWEDCVHTLDLNVHAFFFHLQCVGSLLVRRPTEYANRGTFLEARHGCFQSSLGSNSKMRLSWSLGVEKLKC